MRDRLNNNLETTFCQNWAFKKAFKSPRQFLSFIYLSFFLQVLTGTIYF